MDTNHIRPDRYDTVILYSRKEERVRLVATHTPDNGYTWVGVNARDQRCTPSGYSTFDWNDIDDTCTEWGWINSGDTYTHECGAQDEDDNEDIHNKVDQCVPVEVK